MRVVPHNDCMCDDCMIKYYREGLIENGTGAFNDVIEILNRRIKDYEEVLKNIALLGDYYSQTMAKNVLNGTLEVVKEKDLETKICEPCGGSGMLGFQRETCWFCGGKGEVIK